MKKYLKWSLFVPLMFFVGGILWLKNSMGLADSLNMATYLSYSGPGSFPNIILSIMIICSAIVFIQEFIKIKRSEEEESNSSLRDYINVIALIISILIYIIVMPTIGFIIPTIVLLFICMLLFGERNKILLITVPVCATIIVYLLFTKILSVALPAGILF